MKTKSLKTTLALNKKTIANVRGGIAQGGKIIEKTFTQTLNNCTGYTVCYSMQSCFNTGGCCPHSWDGGCSVW